MKRPLNGTNWFFVDESGDPTFYDRKGNLIVGQEGCSPILLLGFIETSDPRRLRKALLELQQEMVADPYFEGVPSLTKTAIAFHAKDDLPEIRYKVYQLCYQDNRIYFAKRGSRSRQAPLQQAIHRGMQEFEARWGTKVTTHISIQAQVPSDEPCLSIVDYMNWAVYRAFTRGEMRYYRAVEDKVSLLVDSYDHAKYPKNWYNRKNPFDISKITPLSLGPFTERTAWSRLSQTEE